MGALYFLIRTPTRALPSLPSAASACPGAPAGSPGAADCPSVRAAAPRGGPSGARASAPIDRWTGREVCTRATLSRLAHATQYPSIYLSLSVSTCLYLPLSVSIIYLSVSIYPAQHRLVGEERVLARQQVAPPLVVDVDRQQRLLGAPIGRKARPYMARLEPPRRTCR